MVQGPEATLEAGHWESALHYADGPEARAPGVQGIEGRVVVYRELELVSEFTIPECRKH